MSNNEMTNNNDSSVLKSSDLTITEGENSEYWTPILGSLEFPDTNINRTTKKHDFHEYHLDAYESLCNINDELKDFKSNPNFLFCEVKTAVSIIADEQDKISKRYIYFILCK
jgi:hypothetical protein